MSSKFNFENIRWESLLLSINGQAGLKDSGYFLFNKCTAKNNNWNQV